MALEELVNFPDVKQMKRLSAHPLADYRIRIGNYRELFDVDWDKNNIYILKIGHRKDIY